MPPHHQIGPEGPQHALAVVAALGRFHHGGGARGGEGRQQDGALHLGGSHRRGDVGSLQLLTQHRQGGQVAAAAAMDLGPHLGQGFCDSGHGPTSQGGVTAEHKMTPLAAGQKAQHQAHGGARVAAIEDVGRFLEAIEAHAAHQHRLAGPDQRYLHPHRPQTGRRTEGIFRRQETFDAGFTLGDGAKQQGPVGDRLIARHLHLAPQAGAGRQGQAGGAVACCRG